jgi:shikimate 5-dehydrogenase
MEIKRPESLRELIEQGYAFPARLPPKNDFLFKENSCDLDLSRLDVLDGYTVPLIAHDYTAKTPLMWNTLYEKFGLNIRNIMLVANPKDAEIITNSFKKDPKYLGGGFGVGFKEQIKYLDKVVPEDLSAVNIVVKEKGNLVGYNTDALGFVKSLENKLKCINKEIEDASFIVVGAGGVAKEVSRLLLDYKAGHITIINRTEKKAVELAYQLNSKYNESVALGVGENLTRGVLLNSERKPIAIINLSDKGSDKYPDATFFYPTTDGFGDILSSEIIEHLSRDTIRFSVLDNPELVYADIVLPSAKRTKSLRLIESELTYQFAKNGRKREDVEKYILDGTGMVVNQAAPAYVFIQDAHPNIHGRKVNESEALDIFKQAVLA